MSLIFANAILNFLHDLGRYVYQLAIALGGPGLFVVALADSSFLSVPEGNDLLIVVLSTGEGWAVMSYYVAMTVMGSVTGCSLLYAVGRRGGKSVAFRILGASKMEQIESRLQRWGLWTVLIASILPPPTPFKAFVLTAGTFQVPYRRFFAAVLIGRSVRYFTWGVLAVLYGEWAKRILQEQLHTVGSVLLLILVASILLGFWFHFRSRRKTPQQGAA